MTRQDHLFVILSEECIEVAHVVSKILRFGLDDVYENYNCKLDLMLELAHLKAILEVLTKEGIVKAAIDPVVVSEKKQNIEKFLIYSKEHGRLDE